MFDSQLGLQEFLKGVLELQGTVKNLFVVIYLSTEANKDGICQLFVYIESHSVRIFCRSFIIHFWKFNAAPNENGLVFVGRASKILRRLGVLIQLQII
jgi:hypothetical protein